MKIIRILIKEYHVETSIESGDRDLPVESIQKINLPILLEFIENWKNWLKQMDALSFAFLPSENDYFSRFQEFRATLYSLLFGNLSDSLNTKEIVWILDSEIMSLPVEILQYNQEQTFYRNIRTKYIPPSNLKGEGYLYVENHFDASLLMEKMVAEREEVLGIWDRDNILYKQILGVGCTRSRFIEKITGVSVLHYSGHSFENGIYFLDGAFLDYSDLSSMNLSNLKLVSLNSCSSAIGLARGFLEAGARECVGFLGPIRNDLSYEIGKIFWEFYRTTESAAISVLKTRNHLEGKYGKGFPAIYQFVHFGVPNKNQKKKRKLSFITILSGFLLISALMLYMWEMNSTKKIQSVERKKNSKEPEKENLSVQKPATEIKNPQENRPTNPPLKINTEKKQIKNQIKNQITSRVEENKKIKKEIKPIEIEKNEIFINRYSKNERLQKYIDALKSNSLKVKIRKYLNRDDTLYPFEKKVETLEKILEYTDSEDLIEYKLGNLE